MGQITAGEGLTLERTLKVMQCVQRTVAAKLEVEGQTNNKTTAEPRVTDVEQQLIKRRNVEPKEQNGKMDIMHEYAEITIA